MAGQQSIHCPLFGNFYLFTKIAFKPCNPFAFIQPGIQSPLYELVKERVQNPLEIPPQS